MRVLMTTDTVGGVFTYTMDLAAALGQHGVEVEVATFGRRLARWQRERLSGAGAELVLDTALALEWMPDPWRDLRDAEVRLLELEAVRRPDVVHLGSFAPAGAMWSAPVLVVGHSCVFSWWHAVHGCQPPAEWCRYRGVVRQGLISASEVVAPSRAMAAALQRWYGPLRTTVRVIVNGSAYVGAETAVVKRPLVLGAGRLWDAAKNSAALERAAERPGLRGRVLLAGERTTSGERTASGDATETAPSAARWLGPLTPDALSAVRRRAAVYAAPARYEPFGLGILEAARDRCALVLGDIPSLREIWADAAVFVDPDDEERLARILEGLLNDADRAAALGERARARSEQFSLRAMRDSYMSLYRRLATPASERAA
jgi:glycogen synthase